MKSDYKMTIYVVEQPYTEGIVIYFFADIMRA